MNLNIIMILAACFVVVWLIILMNRNRPSAFSWQPWQVGRRPVQTVDGFERSNATIMRRKTNDGRWIYRDMTTAEREGYIAEQLWLNSW